jgi:hypothetical protein
VRAIAINRGFNASRTVDGICPEYSSLWTGPARPTIPPCSILAIISTRGRYHHRSQIDEKGEVVFVLKMVPGCCFCG